MKHLRQKDKNMLFERNKIKRIMLFIGLNLIVPQADAAWHRVEHSKMIFKSAERIATEHHSLYRYRVMAFFFCYQTFVGWCCAIYIIKQALDSQACLDERKELRRRHEEDKDWEEAITSRDGWLIHVNDGLFHNLKEYRAGFIRANTRIEELGGQKIEIGFLDAETEQNSACLAAELNS
jgi:hypothetical protein